MSVFGEIDDDDREALDAVRDVFLTIREGLRMEGKREATELAKAELHDALVALVKMRRGAP